MAKPGCHKKLRIACTFGRAQPDLEVPPLGIARALGAPRTITAMTAVALNPHALLGGVAFVIQALAVRAGHGLDVHIVVEVLGGYTEFRPGLFDHRPQLASIDRVRILALSVC